METNGTRGSLQEYELIEWRRHHSLSGEWGIQYFVSLGARLTKNS